MVAPTQPKGMPSPSKKRRIKSSPKKRGPRRIFFFTSLPFDIFFEIVSHFHPMDILTLSRTAKSYYKLFRFRSTGQPFWRAARRSMGIPDCPADLSEAQYALLMFDTECHVCGKVSRGLYTQISLRLVLCSECSKNFMIFGPHLAPAYGTAGKTWSMSNLTERETIYRDLRMLVPQGSCPRTPPEHFYRPIADVIMQQREQKRASSTPGEYEAWVEEQASTVEIQMQEAHIIESWRTSYQESLRVAREEETLARSIRVGLRKEYILDRLRRLGHEQVDIVFQDEMNKRELEKVSPVTDDVWAIISGQLEAEVRGNRYLRFCLARKRELCDLYPSLVIGPAANWSTEFVLPLQEFLHLPSMFLLWNGDPWESIIWSQEIQCSLDASVLPLFGMITAHITSIFQLAQNEPFPGQAIESSIQMYLDKVDIKKKGQGDAEKNRIRITVDNLWTIGHGPREVDLTSRQLPCSQNSSTLLLPSSTLPPMGLRTERVFACSECHQALTWPGLMAHACIRNKAIQGDAPAWYTYKSIIWRDTFVYSSQFHALVLSRIFAPTARKVTSAAPSPRAFHAVVCLCCPVAKPRRPLDFITHIHERYFQQRCLAALKQRVLLMDWSDSTPALRRWAAKPLVDNHDPTQVQDICIVRWSTPGEMALYRYYDD